MKIIEKFTCLCHSCMEEHEIAIVQVDENNIFKGEPVAYTARYHYCENTDECYETEEQMAQNDASMKDAYRKKVGLLTSNDILDIRKKYGVSQSDLALFLGWGEKTITRYEGHQVQDVAHDSILRKIDKDPEWFLQLLKNYHNKHRLPAYYKYYNNAMAIFENQSDEYLKKSILGAYAKYNELNDYNGYVKLELNKIVDVIRYFSNSKSVKSLYKVKLMKMLWYSDAFSFKNTGKAITGLVYKALPMGAVPIADDLIIKLKGVMIEEIDFEEGSGYHFLGDGLLEYPSLDSDDITVLNTIIERFGDASKKEIVEKMHSEEAYIKAPSFGIIKYNSNMRLSL